VGGQGDGTCWTGTEIIASGSSSTVMSLRGMWSQRS